MLCWFLVWASPKLAPSSKKLSPESYQCPGTPLFERISFNWQDRGLPNRMCRIVAGYTLHFAGVAHVGSEQRPCNAQDAGSIPVTGPIGVVHTPFLSRPNAAKTHP